jgi:hypothetical protein
MMPGGDAVSLEMEHLEILKRIVDEYLKIGDPESNPIIWRNKKRLQFPGGEELLVARPLIEFLAARGYLEIRPFAGRGAVGAEELAPTDDAFDAVDLMPEEGD